MSCMGNMPHRSAWRRSRKPVAANPSAPPLTCCLSAGAYRNRIAWIESFTRRALQIHARDDLVLGLAYAPEAAADVPRWNAPRRF